MPQSKMTIESLVKMKENRKKITAVVTYSYTMARRAEEAGIDAILVGDSATRVFSGLSQHSSMTMESMLYHTQAVTAACSHAWVMADLPQAVIDAGPGECVKGSRILIENGKADCVKIESTAEDAVKIIEAISKDHLPVMGHFGMMADNDERVKNKDSDSHDSLTKAMLDFARRLVSAGSCALLLSKIDSSIAAKITENVDVPTIGIGSGIDCDGQILVLEDLLGLTYREHPYYVKQYAQLGQLAQKAISEYIEDVKSNSFPDRAHSKPK